jgi:hypothetical protein
MREEGQVVAAGGMRDGEAVLRARRDQLQRVLGRPLPPVLGLAEPALRTHLVEQAEELYWNDLEWEKLQAEQTGRRSDTVEFAFPGFLPFIEGLLLREVNPNSPIPAAPRPEIVEDVLRMLAARVAELDGAREPEAALEAELTGRLLDLVLYRLHELTGAEVTLAESARMSQRGEP